MPNRTSSPRRLALTLVELIVVIAIILVIAALAAAFLPRLGRDHTFSNAANSVQGLLLGAKMRAKRDNLPTGIRFLTDASAPGICTTIQLIQQPDAFTSPVQNPPNPPLGYLSYSRTWQAVNGKPNQYQAVYTISQHDAGIDFTGGATDPRLWLVQAGDRILFQNANPFLLVSGQRADQQVTWTATNGVIVAGKPAPSPQDSVSPTTNWKVYRQPRRILGEADFSLPNQIVIDLDAMTTAGVTLNQGPAQLAEDGTPAGPCYDLLFAPSGALAITSPGMVVVWMRDATISLPSSQTDLQALIAINSGTGFIRVSEAGPVNNPFLYVQTGRESGM